MSTTPFDDWRATVLARVRRMGLSATERGEYSSRTIDVTDKDGAHRFSVFMGPKREGFVAGIVRPGDYTLQDLPHSSKTGVLQPIEDRIAYVGPEDRKGGEKLLAMLGAEIARALEPRSPPPPGSPEEVAKIAERFVELATGDPETAMAALENAFNEVLSPRTVRALMEALDRHVEAVPGPGMR